METDRM